MNYLIELGINENDILQMKEVNTELLNLTDNEIEKMISILESIGCDNQIINNIIVSNPMYLSRSSTDILKLINKLQSLGIKRLDITFDSNPWLLNYDEFEINNFIEEKKNEGLDIDDIIDMINSGSVE